MTLFKQIALLFSGMLLTLMLIFVYNDFVRTGNFMQGQLRSTAQDMVTTLGVAVSNTAGAEDPAALEVLFNSVFDSGYYTLIELVGPDGEILHQKKQKLDIEGVPEWFIKLVPIGSAEGSTFVMKGWVQLGQLRLQIHPGYAYSSLYQTFISTLQGFFLIALMSLIILWLVLRIILRPLDLTKDQADAIHRNRFVQQKNIPRTKELKRVVEAMNLMVSKVQSIFDDQANTLTRYQELLYRDKLTGLGNRTYFLEQLQQSLSEEQRNTSHIAMVKIANYEQIRQSHGYEACDNYIRIIADCLQREYSGLSTEKLSRFSKDEFAFLISAEDNALVQFIDQAFKQFQTLLDSNAEKSEVFLTAGICQLESDQTIGAILSSIDYCLSTASTSGPFAIEQKMPGNVGLPEGKMQWRQWLEDCIKTNRLFLVGQLALEIDQTPFHREVFVRAKNSDGEVVPASAFMPMASSLGMSLDIDIQVFKLVREKLDSDNNIALAINLSPAFFELARAQQEFNQLLSDCADKRQKLCIEASHHILLKHPIMCQKIAERTTKTGHSFGIDNLDLGLPLQFIQSGHFQYVKMSAETLHQLNNKNLPSGFHALKTMTDTLGMQFIAVGIDAQPRLDELKELGIGIMQGNLLDNPGVF